MINFDRGLLPLTCRQFIGFLTAYLEGELSPGDYAEFERHLADCSDCTIYLRSYTETIRLGKAAFATLDEPILSEVPEELGKLFWRVID